MPRRSPPRAPNRPLTPARAAAPARTRAWLRGGGRLPARPDVTLPLERELGRLLADAVRRQGKLVLAAVRLVIGAREDARSILKDKAESQAERLARILARPRPTHSRILKARAQSLAERIEAAGRAAANAQVARVTGVELWKKPAPVASGVAEFMGAYTRRVRDLETRAVRTVRAGAIEPRTVVARVSERVEIATGGALAEGQSVGSSLAGALEEVRQREVGIGKYKWRIINSPTGDEKVRPEHRALDGSLQSWTDPPVTDRYGNKNHPGQAPNCRCRAEPAPDEILAAVNRAR